MDSKTPGGGKFTLDTYYFQNQNPEGPEVVSREMKINTQFDTRSLGILKNIINQIQDPQAKLKFSQKIEKHLPIVLVTDQGIDLIANNELVCYIDPDGNCHIQKRGHFQRLLLITLLFRVTDLWHFFFFFASPSTIDNTEILVYAYHTCGRWSSPLNALPARLMTPTLEQG